MLNNEQNISKAMELTKLCIKAINDMESNLRNVMLIVDKNETAETFEISYETVKQVTAVLQEEEIIKDSLVDTLDVNSSNPLDVQLPEKISSLKKSINQVRQTIKIGIKQEDESSQISGYFAEADDNLKILISNIDAVMNLGKTLDKVYEAKDYIYVNSVTLLNLTTDLENAYRLYANQRVINQTTAYFLSIFSFLAMMIWSYLLYKVNKQSLLVTEQENRKVQQEIHKLLEELTGLAKGDLTVYISAKDGITKDIATAINYSVNALRHVVFNINQTTLETSKVANEATKIAEDLAKSSEHQAEEISEASYSVHSMVTSIEQVSSNASKSEAVALESVNIANKGGEVVRNTIQGMERIRAQIVDTSEKIRRLSESSQEIGEIVSLIEGIAEQTNILSLNASIQAATAGEAGRGFAVVADEVQQLAEKAGSATKEIESLVKSIQMDTQHVIAAMEQTRAEVGQGVELAQDAGKALEKIEAVSNHLSKLVKNISMSAHEQTLMSNKISTMMSAINDITNKTATGTVNTANYIANLTQLITDLRHSVSEFKLPKSNYEFRE